MKKIILILLLVVNSVSMTSGYSLEIDERPASYHSEIAEENSTRQVIEIDGLGTLTRIRTSIPDESGYLTLVTTESILYISSLNITVNSKEAVVVITPGKTSYKQLKAIVEKDDTEYIYNVVSEVESLPLQMGSGKYGVSLLGSNDGRRYRLLSNQSFDVELEENAVFLSKTQTVNWDYETEVADLAIELTEGLETDIEKLEAIHLYIIENVKYDYDKATKLPKGYIPDPESTLAEGLGICYDFAALLASMLRAVDVPTKLVKGYSSYTPVYHAWNEVLIDEEWYVVDSSTDSIFLDAGVKYKLKKPDASYVSSKVY